MVDFLVSRGQRRFLFLSLSLSLSPVGLVSSLVGSSLMSSSSLSLFDVPGWTLGAVKAPPVLSNRKLKAEKRNKRKAEAQIRNETDVVKKQKVETKQQQQQQQHSNNDSLETRKGKRDVRKPKEPVARNQEKKGVVSNVNGGFGRPESETTNNTATENGKEGKRNENRKNRNKKDKVPVPDKGVATIISPEQSEPTKLAATTNRKDEKATGNKKNPIKNDKVQPVVEVGSPKKPDIAADNNGLDEKATGNKKKRTAKNKEVLETSDPSSGAVIESKVTKPVNSESKVTKPVNSESKVTKPVNSTTVPKGSLPSTKPLSKNDKKKLLQSLQRGKERQIVENKAQPISADAPTVTETEGFVRSSQVSQNDASNQLTRLQQEMQKKLRGAKFRWLNEQLYTTSGEEGFKLFNEQPELFEIYHSGFRSQVESWPTNPLDIMIEQLRQASEDWIVADMGCGEARLSISVPQKVHSFDLVAANDRIVACDVKHVPLPDEHVDVVVFCLALMGTNYLDFLKEAHRILKNGGEIKIAEVTSRITDVKAFVNSLSTLGFTLAEKDMSNSHFILFRFTKSGTSGKSNGKKSARKTDPDTSETAVLKPCIYKRR